MMMKVQRHGVVKQGRAVSVQVCIIGDVHLSDKPPSQCTESYNDDLFDLLYQIVGIAGTREVDAVVFAGDIFHIKQSNRTSHRLVQRMIQVVQSFKCPVYVVPGNHDLLHDRFDSLLETQPLGVVVRAGLKLLDGWATNLPIYGVPWQPDWTTAPSEGAGWPAAFVAWRAGGPGIKPDGLLITHAPLYPPGKELPYEFVPATDISDLMVSGYCYYGHVHPAHGVYKVDRTWFCNQGAISRGSLHEEDLTRVPAVTIWDNSRQGADAFERVVLVAKPASEVFRLQEHIQAKEYSQQLNEFLAQVSSSTVQVTSIESVISHLKEMGLEAGVEVKAIELLQGV